MPRERFLVALVVSTSTSWLVKIDQGADAFLQRKPGTEHPLRGIGMLVRASWTWGIPNNDSAAIGAS